MNDKTYSPIYNIQLNQMSKNELQIHTHTHEIAVIIYSQPHLSVNPYTAFSVKCKAEDLLF